MIDLSSLSLSELKALPEQLEAEIARRQGEEKSKLLEELEKLAAQKGFSLQDLAGNSLKKSPRTKVAAKYRNPVDQSLTWTGRGRQPKWVVAFIEAGGTLEQLSI